MSLQVEKLEKNMARLTVEVAAEDFKKALEQAYQKEKSKIAIPGFRKGKAPRKVIEQMYGKGVFYEDAANALIPDAYEKALDAYTAEGYSPEIVSSPKIGVTQMEEGKSFIFTAEVALKPEVVLGQYKGLEIPKADLEVTEEEIDAAIEVERNNSARTITLEDGTVENGDTIKLDFEGFVDGVAFEGGKGEDYELTIGSGTFIPGFEEGLIGVALHGQKDVEVTFPENYQAEELAGKAAVFACTVNEIKRKELPELDDDFASDVSTFETMAEYREDVKKGLADKKAEEAKTAREDAVVNAIIADAQMEVPDAMLEDRQRQMVDEFKQNIQYQGVTFEQYTQYTGVTESKLFDSARSQALQQIQSRLVLEAVAAAEGLTASDEDVDAEVAKMAENYKMEADKVREILGENGEKQVREDICVKKALQLVADSAVEV